MRRAALVAGVLVSLADASAQDPGRNSSADPRPAFDVTSVKPSRPGDPALRNRFTPLRISWDNAPLKVLIQIAYDVAHYRPSREPIEMLVIENVRGPSPD